MAEHRCGGDLGQVDDCGVRVSLPDGEHDGGAVRAIHYNT